MCNKPLSTEYVGLCNKMGYLMQLHVYCLYELYM